jgi:hypothetical protein
VQLLHARGVFKLQILLGRRSAPPLHPSIHWPLCLSSVCPFVCRLTHPPVLSPVSPCQLSVFHAKPRSHLLCTYRARCVSSVDPRHVGRLAPPPYVPRARHASVCPCQVGGLPTNRAFLERLARHPAFQAAQLDTGFIKRHAEELLTAAPPLPRSAAAAALAFHHVDVQRVCSPQCVCWLVFCSVLQLGHPSLDSCQHAVLCVGDGGPLGASQ